MSYARLGLAAIVCLAAAAWLLPGRSPIAAALGPPALAYGSEPSDERRPARPPESSVLILTEGIQGGFIGPRRNFVAAFSYDWNRRRYRAVVRGYLSTDELRAEPLRRSAVLREDEFRCILDGVRDLGLAELPVEQPAECEDVYGRNVGIELLHEGRAWHNRAPGGCVSSRSSVRPTPAERERFDAVVAFVLDSLAGLDLHPASALDDAVAVCETPEEAHALQRAVEHLEREGLADLVDSNRVRFERVPGAGAFTRLRLALRHRQHRSDLALHDWPDHVLVVAAQDALQVQLPPGALLSGPTPVDRARREAYLAEHPDLAAPLRELIGHGWIDAGMTPDMVRAAWGEPRERHGSGSELTWIYDGGPAQRAARLSFRDGALVHLPWVLHAPAR